MLRAPGSVHICHHCRTTGFEWRPLEVLRIFINIIHNDALINDIIMQHSINAFAIRILRSISVWFCGSFN